MINSHSVLQVGLGGRQLLFTAPAASSDAPRYFCLRHDVDCVVWHPHACLTRYGPRWTHVSTFDALGYVQASKRERKFTTCSPGLKFAAMADGTRHVFVYVRTEEGHNTAAEFVHSFTSSSSSSIADEEDAAVAEKTPALLGLAALDCGSVLVLTDGQLHVLKIPN